MIPARSGSKGLPDKNIKKINYRVLIDYTIQFVKNLTSVTRVFCSIDSENMRLLQDLVGPRFHFFDRKRWLQIVAEITTNHQGDMGKLLKMISLAKESGADYVKLQKRDVETFYSQK